jgi:hypothetical protein
VTDQTGEHCKHDQPEGVWLLAGSFGETLTRGCTVPAGLPLAGPAVNLVAPAKEGCATFMGAAEGEVTYDGEPLPLRTADALPVSYRGVAGNPVTSDAGEYGGYGCGLWFSVPDPAPGEHTLVITGTSDGLAVAVTYELTVSAKA